MIIDPTTAGLLNPNQAPSIEPIGQKRPAATAASQVNPKVAKAKTGMGTYAEVIGGKSKPSTTPIGAKSAPAKVPAKYASGAIGAPVPPQGKATSKAKDKGGGTPIGAASTAKQDAAKPNEPPITSDTALEYLKNAPATQSFADYQQIAQGASAEHEAQAAQNLQDAQSAQDEQIARAYQADLDAQDAAATEPAQTHTFPDLNEEDDAAMQQAMLLSRQQAQSQGSDPQAASSAGATQTTDQELQHELQLGMDYQMEVQALQVKMSQAPLRPDEVARYRTVSQLVSTNHARVAKLCERQVQESIAQQSRSTSAMLGSIRPLNIAKPRGPALKPPPASKDSTGANPPPVSGKQSGATALRKAPPPTLGTDRPLVVKAHPQGPPSAPPKGSGPGAGALPIQSAPPAPSSPKGPAPSHLEGKVVSPRGRPPPRVASRPTNPSRASSVTEGQTPRSDATEATADLEERLRRRKEANRARPEEQGNVRSDDREQPKQHRSRHHKEEHRPGRDTRRRDRSPSEKSSSSDTSDDDHRSPSSRGSRSRRHEHSRRHRSRSRRGSRSDRRRRGSSEEERRSRSKRREGEHRSSKGRRRRDSSSSSQEQESEGHVEERNKSRSSQPAQSKAAESQQMNPPPLPPPAAAPSTGSSTSTGQTQAPAVQQATAQPTQRQVAQAVPATIQTAPAVGAPATHLPLAKAVPLHQPQGHAQAAAQSAHRAMPARQSQGHVQLAQPLPQPMYPTQQQLIAVQPRPQAQQLAAPPGLGTNLELTQAAHIHQMEQQVASLQAQLRAVQPQAQSRQSSHSPEGWDWGGQSQGSQWHGHGWYGWGNGRGYQ